MSFLTKLLLAGTVVVAAKGLDNRLEVSHYSISSGKIPEEFDGFRILHLSDFHCDSSAGLSDAIRGEHPDIICITGDMTHDTGSYMPFINLLEDLLEIAPVYMVSGNHDVWRSDFNELIGKCIKMGAVFLKNESVLLKKNNSCISISGIEDPYFVTHTKVLSKVNQGLEKIKKIDGFNMLLFHRANLLDIFKDCGFDLILSGHMHGGQFRIPGVGGVVSPKTNFLEKGRIFFPKYFGGKYQLDNTKLIVSRGVGNPTILPRVFNRPEICTIILNKKSVS